MLNSDDDPYFDFGSDIPGAQSQKLQWKLEGLESHNVQHDLANATKGSIEGEYEGVDELS